MTLASNLIILNGTSSAGKSSLAAALRPLLPASFCFYTSDQLADAGFRPMDGEARRATRDAFFAGFHHSIAAFASAGLDVLVEHVIEQQNWADELAQLLTPYPVLWVGVVAPLAELERRERARGDRTIGEARFHLRTHEFCRYDLTVDTTAPLDEGAKQIAALWRSRHGASYR